MHNKLPKALLFSINLNGEMPMGSLDGNIVTQICIVTDRLDETASRLEAMLGVTAGPVVIAAHPSEATEHLGVDRFVSARTRAFQLQNIVLELLEPNDEPSTWRQFLTHRGPGVHHIAFRAGNLETARNDLRVADIAELQKGEFVDGSGRYAVFDTLRWLGTFIEVFETGKRPTTGAE